MKVLIFGAGSTGRGHLAALLHEHGCRDMVFVDKDERLVGTLRNGCAYKVRLLGKNERVLNVSGFEIFSRGEETEIINAFLESDIMLTAVIAENLENVSEAAAAAITARSVAGIDAPYNIICCENLQNASTVLKEAIYAKLGDKARAYADDCIGFPDAIISRVVPLALENPLYLLAEDYNEWFVRKRGFKGEDPGWPFMTLVDNLEALLEKKLWIHNGGHASVAYAGFQKGCRYIHEAIGDAEIAALAGQTMEEIGRAVRHKHGFSEKEIGDYITCFVARGQIAEMKDDILRVVRDPIRKLGLHDRLVGPALYAAEHGLENGAILRSIANVLLCDNPGDAESAMMRSVIEAEGPEAFLRDKLGIGNGSIVQKITKLLECGKNERTSAELPHRRLGKGVL